MTAMVLNANANASNSTSNGRGAYFFSYVFSIILMITYRYYEQQKQMSMPTLAMGERQGSRRIASSPRFFVFFFLLSFSLNNGFIYV